MAISWDNGTVAQGAWNVGRTTGHGMPPGGRLSVFKGFAPHRDKHGFPIARLGDHDGREFETDSEYETFVRSRGYVQPYRRVSLATFKRINRALVRAITDSSVASIRGAESVSAVVDIANSAKARARAAGCDLLDSLSFANGVYIAARRLRPDLYTATPFRPIMEEESLVA